MKNNIEIFLFDSTDEGLILKNRDYFSPIFTEQGLCHDIFEHPYIPIKNKYCDEIAALGAYDCFSNEQNISINLSSFIWEIFEIDYETNKLKWDKKYLNTKLCPEIIECISYLNSDNFYNKNNKFYKFINKYKYIINYYFLLGKNIFYKRFDNYFYSYYDLYELGNKIYKKLLPLISSEINDIKLIINYKNKDIKIEY